jgi:hypothetical protein
VLVTPASTTMPSTSKNCRLRVTTL